MFVDGDFWHGRDFESRRAGLLAGNNGAFWVAKIERNMACDTEVDESFWIRGVRCRGKANPAGVTCGVCFLCLFFSAFVSRCSTSRR